MVIPMSACSSKDASKPKDTGDSGKATKTETEAEGKVLNIQCWNEEFKSRVTDHYPGYEKTGDNSGKIGDVTVNWIITPTKDNAYQNNLDKILPENANASADDKVDIFLMEADYALKYVNSDTTMALKDIGISDDDLADQFDYTKDT